MGTKTEIKNWQLDVSELLARAAKLAVEHEVDVDLFVRSAYTAYLEARPGLREELFDRQLEQQIEELRRRGQLPSA